MSTSIQEGTDTQLGALREEELLAWLDEQPEAGCEVPQEFLSHSCGPVVGKCTDCVTGSMLICQNIYKILERQFVDVELETAMGSTVRCAVHPDALWLEHNQLILV